MPQVRAVARRSHGTVDLRPLDTPTQAKLEQAVEASARRASEQEGVGFHMDKSVLQDYSKARRQEERLNDPVVSLAHVAFLAGAFAKPPEQQTAVSRATLVAFI
jgi:hypothetical protein